MGDKIMRREMPGQDRTDATETLLFFTGHSERMR